MTWGAPNLSTVRRARADGSKKYRCFYHPLDKDGYPVANESSHLPHIDLRARSNEEAHHKAFKKAGCPIAEVQRLEGPAS